MINRICNPRREAAFYVTGGTLDRDAPSYVARQADRRLYAALTEGKFCYVLTSRQMGKSSLMVRTAARLRDDGVVVAVLDLTAIGQNLDAEQWYDGLLARVGQQLDLEDELEAFWLKHGRLGPLQRWMRAVRDVVLAHTTARVVIFVDEIDAVRSMPFSTDEFFAGIREFYNRRSDDPELERLTFCLLGVATPSDLIRDTRMTPFNIGERIELHDFTEAEAAPLARGLGYAGALNRPLLQRVLYWTGGHPYLTQRLCQVVAGDMSVHGDDGVDRLCGELFLSSRARERDDNLLFVRERLLRSGVDSAGLLELYASILGGKRVRDEEADPLVGVLRLSGITRARDGYLRVRNRIYRRVFDLEWARANMPDAELRRQRAAYRRGVLRSAAVAAVLFVVGLSVVGAIIQHNRARREEATTRRLRYATEMRLAQRAWEGGNAGLVLELLEDQRPGPGQEDLRGFEWYYLWRLCHREDLISLPSGSGVTSVAYSADGRTLASATSDGTVSVWDVAAGKETATLRGDAGAIWSVAFSPGGDLLAAASDDGTVKLWSARTWKEHANLTGHKNSVEAVAFSPDGEILASGSDDGTAKLWDVATGKEIATLAGHGDNAVYSVAFSPDGSKIATGSTDWATKLWSVATGQELLPLKGHAFAVTSVAFTPDGGKVVTASWDNTLKIWDAATGRELATCVGHTGPVSAVAVSPDGKSLVSASSDATARVWNVDGGEELIMLKGHAATVRSAAFSPDGTMLATGSDDKTVKLWDIDSEKSLSREWALFDGRHDAWVRSIAFSRDGATLVTGSDDTTAKVWDVPTRRQRLSLTATQAVNTVVLAPGGQELVAGSKEDWTVRRWSASTGDELGAIQARAKPEVSTRGYGFAVSADGKIAASGRNDAAAMLWDATTGEELRALTGHTERVRVIEFSPDGALLATGSDDMTVRLWDTATGKELASFPELKRIVDIAFSPDGKTLASVSMDKTAKLWDVVTGQRLATLRGHTSGVWIAEFSPDGKRLATTSDDTTIKLWDVDTGQELMTLQGRAGAERVAFSPNGRALVTGSRDGTLKLWQAATDEEVSVRTSPP